MNIELSEKKQRELGKLVLRWARNEGLVAPGEQLTIQLTKKKVNPVAVLPIQEEKSALSAKAIDQILARPIRSLGLSNRSLNPLLYHGGYATIGLVARSDELQLLSVRNFGTKSLAEVKDRLASFGVEFGVQYPVGRKERAVFLDLLTTDDASPNYLQVFFGKPNGSRTWVLCQFICRQSGLQWKDLGARKSELLATMSPAVRDEFDNTGQAIEELASLLVKLKIP